MRRTLLASLCIATLATPRRAQRRPVVLTAAARASIDEFVNTVRDMAAWAIVTPSAHIPAGGIQDTSGNVESVVSPQNGGRITPDSVLVAFRRALGAAARKQKSRAIGLAYLVRQVPPGAKDSLDAVLVEVEHGSGYRADVLCPYTRNEFGEPVFGPSFMMPGTLREMPGARTASRSGRDRD
jgi:hypothetical protein